MRKIEKEEEQISYEEPDKKVFHLCIVNLVIGYVQYFYIIVLNQPIKTLCIYPVCTDTIFHFTL